ncbi:MULTISPECIES: ABC transporter permease [unclassified Imperialibacter]|uniref:ABC transporter permease n=1 Tax=unclassified Imperialibacter TaxID=2629706 RepID=UPI00125A6654|nr:MULTISPECIES: ABC transporter permease [unclassified Imperialibacter]CAD5299345.1 conserved membrane hypothetical protein [Imperialibacter sp. 89]CAD5299932.1 conserved membrane hypothetical protein [Imperialibacter sp. 75]VVT15626.1 conserved membrane hypothetical protein [Imperialibacter sp. EC-SDR9]
MLKSYLMVSIRHLMRQPTYAALNILGLTIGIVSSLLIILYLSQELSYDNHHAKADRIYRISSDIKEPDNAFRWAVTQLPLGRTLKAEFEEVEQYVRFIGNGRTKFIKDNINYFEEDVFQVDSTVFDVFSFDLISGNPSTALQNPSSMVISKTMADKIFKGENPVGQILKTDQNSFEITGVYEDLPKTSHIRPNAMMSASTSDRNNSQNWGGFGIYTYALLREGADPKVVETKLNDIIDKYVAVIFDQFDIVIRYEMIAIKDIHLYSTFEGEPEALGNIKYIYIFAAVALFLIVIASINYMNLSTARSMRRALEVGIRKVMGAQRGMLIGQFITESVVLTVISLVISLIVLAIAVPLFNGSLDTNLSLLDLLQPQLILVVLCILVLTGFVSGSYPAFYLSSFKPAAVLKGKGASRGGNQWLRRVLVGIQFAISIFMLIGTFIIYDQMQYLRSKDLGFDKDQVVRVVLDNQASREKYPVFRNSLMQNPNIKSVASSSTSPGNGYGKNVMSVETNEGVMENYGIDAYVVDYDFFPTLSIPFEKGRNISSQYPSDTATSVMVNEAMVARMGWEEPIGKKFQFDRDSTVFHRVVGVVRDFHQQSLYNPIEALMFIPGLNNSSVLIKTSEDLQASLAAIEASWNEVYPGIPFDATFLDEEFMEQYETDQLRGKLFLGFSLMMIFIACLGLLGLASFIAEQRTKEISIRKVLGANTGGLVTLLVKDFVWLVLIGAVPAFGLGYYFMNDWLKTFEYHVDINLLLFVVVLLIILVITVLTTGYHALRAANSNPANNLKYE